MEQVSYTPIGTLHSDHTSPYEAPRQGTLAEQSQAYIEINKELPVDTFSDLDGFSHIWVVYDFHQAKTWKPKVRPPRGADKKRSVFATRSPYRPNSIGMSCVKLNHIKDHKIFISHHDLLDGTPILDIKPYLAYADSFPEASKGWLEGLTQHEVQFDPKLKEQLDWLSQKLNTPLEQTLTRQLEFDPTLAKAKRVKAQEDYFIFSLRTWRFLFKVDNNKVHIFKIESGYTAKDLEDSKDIYQDKTLHLEFFKDFNLNLT